MLIFSFSSLLQDEIEEAKKQKTENGSNGKAAVIEVENGADEEEEDGEEEEDLVEGEEDEADPEEEEDLDEGDDAEGEGKQSVLKIFFCLLNKFQFFQKRKMVRAKKRKKVTNKSPFLMTSFNVFCIPNPPIMTTI